MGLFSACLFSERSLSDVLTLAGLMVGLTLCRELSPLASKDVDCKIAKNGCRNDRYRREFAKFPEVVSLRGLSEGSTYPVSQLRKRSYELQVPISHLTF